MWTDFLEEVNKLLHEEKAARHENDANRLSELCKRIIQLAFDAKEYRRLNEFILMLTKRRGQSKKAVQEMVQLCMSDFFDNLNREEKLTLVQTCRDATEGKFFAEVEYAKCT